MNEFYRQEIERVRNAYKFRKGKNGELLITYEPQFEDDNISRRNRLEKCLENSRRSYSVVKEIYYAITKNKVKR